jgi:hypothetical protein
MANFKSPTDRTPSNDGNPGNSIIQQLASQFGSCQSFRRRESPAIRSTSATRRFLKTLARLKQTRPLAWSGQFDLLIVERLKQFCLFALSSALVVG